MKNRDIFLPSLTSLLIAGMISFLSCAHQNRVKDELDAQVDETSLDSSDTASAPAEEKTDSGELSLDEEVKSTDTASATESSDEKKLDEDLTALNDNSTTTQESTTTTTNNSDELSLENDLNNSSTTTASETKGAVGNTQTDELSLDNDTSDLDIANGTTETAPVGAGAVAQNDTPKSEELDIPKQEEPPKLEPKETAPILDNSSLNTASEGKRETHHFSGRSRVPHIPGKAVTRKGTKLNRFYFVRKGDTPASVSNLIYGSNDQAKSLTKWNGKHWKAGNVVYYASPTDPKEKTMRSFYQERNISPEEYTVQKGDWLSRVASKKLGNAGSWKEIAVVNGMKRPDALEVGQKLAVYPVDLSGSAPTQVAKDDEPPTNTVARSQVPTKQPEPVQPPVQQQPPPEVVPPAIEPPVAQAPVEQPKVKKEAATKDAFDISKMIDQNMFFGVIAVAVLLLCAAYLMRRRKKAAKEASEDFGEDGFQPPTKLKRK